MSGWSAVFQEGGGYLLVLGSWVCPVATVAQAIDALKLHGVSETEVRTICRAARAARKG